MSGFVALEPHEKALKMRERLRAASVPLIIAPKAWVLWGFFNILISIFAGMLPPYVPGSTEMRNGIILSGALWAAIGTVQCRVPIRISVPVVLLLLLQAWGAFVTYWVSAEIGRARDFNYTDFFLLRYLYLYFTAAMLCHAEPRARKWLFQALLGATAVTAIVAWAQFFKFPPAIRLAEALNPIQDITNWDLRGGVRAMGIYGFPGQTALPCNLVCAILAGVGLFRKLSKFETLLFFFFAGGALIAQARTHVPALILITVVFFIGLSRWDKKAMSSWLLIMTLGLVVMFTFGADKMAYLLSTNWLNDPNLIYRRERAWIQADTVWQYFPITGIGPEPRYWGDTRGQVDKWTPHAGFDNGWLLIRASYGLVGMVMMGIALAIWASAPFRVLRERAASPEQKGFTVAMALGAICIAIGMYGNNILTWEPSMLVFFVLSGMVMKTQSEEVDSMQEPFRELRSRTAS
ncbi:MAG TPA: hypothetical protein PLO61_04365 [Fimbriimonadaceae bacterium]|nr:hypothetical protein [Fimbriimonadaceae bacterium]HRJ32805.1 hypothetical protein [Fimbriimonadaceae bacterium]